MNDERIERINDKVEALNEKMHNLETDIKIMSVTTENMSKSLEKIVNWREEEKNKGNKVISKTGWLIFGGVITSFFSIVVTYIVHII